MEKTEHTQGMTLPKLPYILLELINNESSDAVDYIIARYLLDHFDQLDSASIQDISDACGVSKSTMSRFCRKAGLEDFQEMKDQLHNAKLKPSYKFNVPMHGTDGKGYLQAVSEQVLRLDAALDYQKIDTLVKEIYESRNIILLGSMQAMNPAVNLQQDMLFSHKVMRVPSMFSLQINAIERARPQDLLICFSNSGQFFERLFDNQGDMNLLKELRIWMITGNEKAEKYSYVDEVIMIPQNHGYISHPLQFNLTARVICLAYAEYYQKMNGEK